MKYKITFLPSYSFVILLKKYDNDLQAISLEASFIIKDGNFGPIDSYVGYITTSLSRQRIDDIGTLLFDKGTERERLIHVVQDIEICDII